MLDATPVQTMIEAVKIARLIELDGMTLPVHVTSTQRSKKKRLARRAAERAEIARDLKDADKEVRQAARDALEAKKYQSQLRRCVFTTVTIFGRPTTGAKGRHDIPLMAFLADIRFDKFGRIVNGERD